MLRMDDVCDGARVHGHFDSDFLRRAEDQAILGVLEHAHDAVRLLLLDHLLLGLEEALSDEIVQPARRELTSFL